MWTVVWISVVCCYCVPHCGQFQIWWWCVWCFCIFLPTHGLPSQFTFFEFMALVLCLLHHWNTAIFLDLCCPYGHDDVFLYCVAPFIILILWLVCTWLTILSPVFLCWHVSFFYFIFGWGVCVNGREVPKITMEGYACLNPYTNACACAHIHTVTKWLRSILSHCWTLTVIEMLLSSHILWFCDNKLLIQRDF
jgi:hypothetical protein